MTVRLPEDLGRSVLAEVDGGHFATADEVVAEAVRAFLDDRRAPTAAETAFEVMDRAGLIGRLDAADASTTDLATNPAHMEGFGRDQAGGR